MLIFLHGADSYRRKQKLNQIVTQYEAKNSLLSLQYFDLEEGGEFERLKDFCGQGAFFSAKKLAVTKNIFADVKNLKNINDLLKNYLTDPDAIIIISEESPDAKDIKTRKENVKGPDEKIDFSFLVKKPVLSQKFEKLSENETAAFVKAESTRLGLDLDESAVKKLAQIFSLNTWGLMTTLEKLSLYHSSSNKKNIENSQKRKIQAKDISEFLDYKTESNIFIFINSVLYKKPALAKITALEDLMLKEEDEAKIFNILASRPNMDFPLLEKMANLDIAIKSGKTDYDVALLELAIS